MTPKAIIFDLDGTLVDSERPGQVSGLEAFHAMGVPADAEFMLSLVGKDGVAGRALVREKFGEVDFAELDRLWTQANRANLEHLQAMPGALKVLTALKAHGLPVAVATSSQRPGATAKLAKVGLTALVGLVITRDDVENAKPHPEPYLKAAAALGVDPQTCLAVEDTPTGVAAALAAGCRVLHVPDLLPAVDSPAHLVASTLAEGVAKLTGLDLRAGGVAPK
ncbi:HAD family hydrolase [Pseudaestuariivita sp.]|uniref:HAD family hydrolase n=1 Tax=Pseudaestuariivita sp. TaxID=2211669 RepID=UPI0040581746